MLNPETPKILNYLMEKQHYGFEESYRLMMNLMENQFSASQIGAILCAYSQKGETPQETRGYEGFFHVHHLIGSIEETVLELIIRDHSKKKFEKRKELIEKTTKKFNKKFAKQFGEDIVIAEVKDQYYNMKEKVLPVKHIVDIAEKAMKDLGIKPIIKPIRGGTDGCQLS